MVELQAKDWLSSVSWRCLMLPDHWFCKPAGPFWQMTFEGASSGALFSVPKIPENRNCYKIVFLEHKNTHNIHNYDRYA